MQRSSPSTEVGSARFPSLLSTMVVQPVEALSRRKSPPWLNDMCPCTPSLNGMLVRVLQYGLLASGSGAPLASFFVSSVSNGSSPALGFTLAISQSDRSANVQ